jgi:hypothetical protein
MAIGTPTKAKSVTVGQYVVAYNGRTRFDIGRVVDIQPAPRGRLLLISEWSRAPWLVHPNQIVRVVDR